MTRNRSAQVARRSVAGAAERGRAGSGEGEGDGPSRFDNDRAGQPGREDAIARPAPPTGPANRDRPRWDAEVPALLGGATPAEPPQHPEQDSPQAPAVRKTVPRGWPQAAQSLWSWMAQPRAPLPVLVGGAEGGVGTSTVTALIGEVIAAASPGPTVILDQGGPGGVRCIGG